MGSKQPARAKKSREAQLTPGAPDPGAEARPARQAAPKQNPARQAPKQTPGTLTGVWISSLATGLGLLVVALYVSPLELDFVRSKAYPTLAWALLGMGLAGAGLARGRLTWPRTPLDPFIAAWLAVLTLSTLAAPNLELALHALAVAAAPFVAFVLAVKVARAGLGQWLQGAVALAGAVVGGIALSQAFGISVMSVRSGSVQEVALEGSSALYQTFATLGHKNLVASFCLVAAGAALGLAGGAGSRAGRWWGRGLLIVLAGALAVCHSRTGWAVGLGLTGVFGILRLLAWRGIDPGRALRWAVIGLGVALAVTLLVGGVAVQMRPELMNRLEARLSLPGLWKIFNYRGVHWIVASFMVHDHPLLGVGVGHFGQAYNDHLLEALLYVSDPFTGGNQASQAHCDPLQVAAEAGVLGLVAWLALWGALAVSALSVLRQSGGESTGGQGGVGARIRAEGLILGIAAFLLTGLLDFPGASPPHTLAVWSLAGLLVGSLDPGQRPDRVLTVSRAWRAPATALMVVLLLVGLWRVARLRSADRETVLGRNAYQSGRFEAAQLHLDRALELDPSLSEAHFWRGRAAHRSGDLPLARAELERSRALNGFYAVDLALGALALDQKRPLDAAGFMRRYLRVRPLASPMEYRLGVEALRRAGDQPGAAALEPMADPVRRLERGKRAEAEGRPDEAFDWYTSLQSDEGRLAAMRVALSAHELERARATLGQVQSEKARAEGRKLLEGIPP